MKTIQFPYGKTTMSCSFDEKSLTGVLTSSIEEYVPTADPVTLVQQALAIPDPAANSHARAGIYVSDLPDEMVQKMHMRPAHSLEEAMVLAKQLLGKDSPTVNAIPDGIAVMVKA